MTVEIDFPLEFVVEGTAVSSQAKRRQSIEEWMARIVEASRPHLPEGHFVSADPFAVTLYYFPDTPMLGDIDNIVKPILDALKKHIYLDDRQVLRVVVQKFETRNRISFYIADRCSEQRSR